VFKIPSILLSPSEHDLVSEDVHQTGKSGTVDRVWNTRFWRTPTNDWQESSIRAALLDVDRKIKFEGINEEEKDSSHNCDTLCFERGLWPSVQRQWFMSHFAAESLRERTHRYCDIDKVTTKSTTSNAEKTKVLLILRSRKRRIQNYQALVGELSKKNYEVEVVMDMTGPFCQQVRQMVWADIVVSMHGAELTNGVFMRPTTVVVSHSRSCPISRLLNSIQQSR